MIRAELVLENGLLKSCGISGHSGAGPKGADIVCAAVSVLARTAVKTLSGRNGIAVHGEFPERGEFSMKISAVAGEDMEFLAGISDFLKEGLLSVSTEYPDFCRVDILKVK